MKNLVWLFATASFLFVSHQAKACECVYLSPYQHIELADIVLVAEISNVEPNTQVTLLPTEIIKGKISKPLIFSIGLTSNCDYFPRLGNMLVGERHLLYLRYRERKLNASICTLSGPIEKKEVELEALRKYFK